jgi:hypothetical protein
MFCPFFPNNIVFSGHLKSCHSFMKPLYLYRSPCTCTEAPVYEIERGEEATLLIFYLKITSGE